MDDRTELREFLTSRRARLRPADVGLRDYGATRRVKGLRREELARLAGVSIAHYTRLEQGRGDSVSDEVLDAVGAALRLDSDELAYLRGIARRPVPCERDAASAQQVPASLRYLLRSFEMTPALAVGRHTQIVGWNRLAAEVFGDLAALPERSRTFSHLLFTAPHLHLRPTSRERAAREHVAHLRVLLGRFRGDPGLAAHIDQLSDLSPDFARMWAEHHVAQVRNRTYVLDHPVAGELTLHGELIALPDQPSCLGLDLFAAEPGSASERALRKASERALRKLGSS